jgi:TatD DNase family protein
MEINAPCWVDTHIHWDASEFDVDREQALVRAKQAGVIACFNPSVIASGFESVRDLAAASLTRCDWPRILPAYGVHPLYVMQATDADLAALEQQLVMHRPLAVGEIGLDGYPGAPDMTQQRTWFEAQLALAAKYSLPVLLHVRHAVEDVIQCLKRVQGQRQKIPGGIAHAFNGSENQAEQLIRMGFMLGFGGSLT